MNYYFLIHGSYGNPYKNWFPWLREELGVRGKKYIVPHFPSFEKQNYQNWSNILKSYLDIGMITEDTTFITHSLGGIFLVKFLLENNRKVKKIVFVAAFNHLVFERENELYDSFYVEEKKLENFKMFCQEMICIYSNNDPYIPEEDAIHFANKIGAKKVLLENAGHFTGKYGYREFKELWNYL